MKGAFLAPLVLACFLGCSDDAPTGGGSSSSGAPAQDGGSTQSDGGTSGGGPTTPTSGGTGALNPTFKSPGGEMLARLLAEYGGETRS